MSDAPGEPKLHSSKIKAAAVIGGGFYACYLACELASAGIEVELFERGSELMSRASFWNQARVHGGYHYPRHTPTALRSRVNYPRFAAEFADCLKRDFKHIYAIARSNSKVSAKQFHHFMTKIGSPLEPVSQEDMKFFDPQTIEAAFYVDECAFDSVKLRATMSERLGRAGVRVQLNASVKKVIEQPAQRFSLEVARALVAAPFGLGLAPEIAPQLKADSSQYDLILNCTYCDLLDLHFAKKPSVLEYEIAELALVELPVPLQKFAFTLMCGPFFSTLPFPSTNYHSFSHVRYTPHLRWTSLERTDSSKVLAEYQKESRFEYMIRDAQKYMPSLKLTKYVKSFFEVKTLLPQNSNNDGRPIFFEKDQVQPKFISIMGGKIDNVYDIAERIREELLS